MLLLLTSSRPRICLQIRNCTRQSKSVFITKEEVSRFIQDCMVSVGTSKHNACMLASVLVAADEKGHYSHGLNRLANYVSDIKEGRICGSATPEIEKESVATAWVNGNSTLGAVVGHFCMDLAIKKATEVGIGFVTAHNSSHYGVANYYTVAAMKKGFIGFTCTNTSPLMVPFGSKEVGLGSNPLSLAAPAKDCDSFVIDMSTTSVAKGKIEVGLREGKKLPVGWVQDADGKPVTDPEEALASGRMLPAAEAKGTGLAIFVEVLSGILAGGNYGLKIPKWGQAKGKSNLCHCFMAINPENFASCFEERMSDLLNTIRGLKTVKQGEKMMVPGDPERLQEQQVAEAGAIKYASEYKTRVDELAKELGVEPIKPKC